MRTGGNGSPPPQGPPDGAERLAAREARRERGEDLVDERLATRVLPGGERVALDAPDEVVREDVGDGAGPRLPGLEGLADRLAVGLGDVGHRATLCDRAQRAGRITEPSSRSRKPGLWATSHTWPSRSRRARASPP